MGAKIVLRCPEPSQPVISEPRRLDCFAEVFCLVRLYSLNGWARRASEPIVCNPCRFYRPSTFALEPPGHGMRRCRLIYGRRGSTSVTTGSIPVTYGNSGELAFDGSWASQGFACDTHTFDIGTLPGSVSNVPALTTLSSGLAGRSA